MPPGRSARLSLQVIWIILDLALDDHQADLAEVADAAERLPDPPDERGLQDGQLIVGWPPWRGRG